METTSMTTDLFNTTNLTLLPTAVTKFLEHTSRSSQNLPVIQLLQIIIFTIVCLVGLVGNTLVIYVVIRFSKMQTVTNMYIVNLAIADECFLVGIPFLIITMVNRGWIFGRIACKAYMISTSINQYTSSILLSIMSADRYVAVCHPISSPRWRTPFISGMVSVLAWTCSLLLMFPIIQHASIFEHGDNTSSSCVIDWTTEVNISTGETNITVNTNATGLNNTSDQTGSNSAGDAIFITYTFVFSFAIPLCMTMIFYCLVIQKLKTVGPKNKSKEKKRSHRKVTNLVLTVVTVYICCWLPYWVMQLASLSSSSVPDNDSSNFFVTLHVMVACLSYSNSAMNPILYAFLSDNFKKSFLKACTCATGRDINATLHLENSVFPRKHKQGSARFRPTRGTSIIPNNEDECDLGPLVSKGDASTSAITMTSRTNITSVGDSRDSVTKRGSFKNGNVVLAQPTTL